MRMLRTLCSSVMTNADEDLEMLLDWLPFLEGKPIHAKTPWCGSVADALKVVNRLMSVGDANAIVLLFTYLITPGDFRNERGQSIRAWTPLDERIGLLFATPQQRVINPHQT